MRRRTLSSSSTDARPEMSYSRESPTSGLDGSDDVVSSAAAEEETKQRLAQRKRGWIGWAVEQRYVVADALVLRGWIPDAVVRRGVRLMLWDRLREFYYRISVEEQLAHKRWFVSQLKLSHEQAQSHTQNGDTSHGKQQRQHQQREQQPSPEFFRLVLGKRMKYSCAFYKDEVPEQLQSMSLVRDVLENNAVSSTLRSWCCSNRRRKRSSNRRQPESSPKLQRKSQLRSSSNSSNNNNNNNNGHRAAQARELDLAEDAMLKLYCKRIGLRDGMSVLDVGCGWGAFALYAAQRYPSSHVTALTNVAAQAEFVVERAAALGLTNVRVVTANMAEFDPKEQLFDRIVCVEVLERMRSYRDLLRRVASWLHDDGRVLVQMFVHREYCYSLGNDGTWMARQFFHGMHMPSDDLLTYFQKSLKIVSHWRMNGRHYARTYADWIKNMDDNKALVIKALERTHGAAQAWQQFAKWRLFFVSCEEQFGYSDGQEWLVSQYLFSKKRSTRKQKS